MEKVPVFIVGAGPSGLAVAACLTQASIPYVIVEREDCSASLWRKRTYDRLKLHLPKEFCELPHMPYPKDYPTHIPKDQFLRYVDAYAEHFEICPKFSTLVESGEYDEENKCWAIKARDQITDLVTEYKARFLVVATGENSEGKIPNIPGIHDFHGEIIHSSKYRSARNYVGKRVLVVGCGNSGMEIAYDLGSNGVDTSVVIRSPLHVTTLGMVHLGMKLAHWKVPMKIVDFILVALAYFHFGDLSKYGIVTPTLGPLQGKEKTGRSPVVDVGTVDLIKKDVIKVLGPIRCIIGNTVEFEDGRSDYFDSIVLATGYKSNINMRLKNGESMLNEVGMPKKEFPNHWKGENGLYCVGLAWRGLAGINYDAKKIAEDIKSTIGAMEPF